MLKVIDADVSNQTSIVYDILPNVSGVFSVGKNTGDLKTSTGLDTTSGMTWTLHVNATDDYGEGFSDTTRVLVSMSTT